MRPAREEARARPKKQDGQKEEETRSRGLKPGASGGGRGHGSWALGAGFWGRGPGSWRRAFWRRGSACGRGPGSGWGQASGGGTWAGALGLGAGRGSGAGVAPVQFFGRPGSAGKTPRVVGIQTAVPHVSPPSWLSAGSRLPAGLGGKSGWVILGQVPTPEPITVVWEWRAPIGHPGARAHEGRGL